MTAPGATPPFEVARGAFVITTDASRFDLDAITAFLARSYWAEAIPREIVARAIAGSLAFGLFDGARQIGFARAVTDRATFAYLADVYVLEEYRGRGLGKWLTETVLSHPELQGLRRWVLVTRDAHRLYAGFGFTPPANPAGYMEIARPGIYKTRPRQGG